MAKSLDKNQQQLYRMIRDGEEVWVLYLDIVKFHEVEFRYGYKVCRQILAEFEAEVEYTLKQQRSLYLFSMLEGRGGDDFVVYFVPGEDMHWDIKVNARHTTCSQQ